MSEDDDALLPAWSEPFIGDRADLVRPVRLAEVTRDWAFAGARGAGVRVAVIDSGMETDHPALAGRVVESVSVDLSGEEPEVVPDNAGDLYGHGTACGGIILGLAPEVELVSVRVLGADLKGKGVAFLAAIEWVLAQGIRVASLSLSSRSEALFPAFHEVVDRAAFGGLSLVCAANNVPGASYPSLFSSVISVASHDIADPELWFHNPEPPVEFGAWGVDVPVAWKDGGSIVATGNSFATPHMAGHVARLVGRHPGLTPFEVKAILAATAADPRVRTGA
ncbi:MAG: S8 family serine peptidase [Chloroflexota bacterium]